MNFKETVKRTPDIKHCFQQELKGLGDNSGKIILSDKKKCGGSVNIDECVTKKYPQSNRWDYCFCYKEVVYFVEVHPANTHEVSVVLKKLQWLKDWLNTQAPELNKIKSKKAPYYWIQSGKFNIPKTSRQYRVVSQVGIKPITKLE